ncbi:MAG TPA: hypothetical protein VFH85_01425 [Gammaproteobacteria bacterium]|nr:hypothetical protein [Gammaproteobacteria bacterium]
MKGIVLSAAVALTLALAACGNNNNANNGANDKTMQSPQTSGMPNRAAPPTSTMTLPRNATMTPPAPRTSGGA